MYRVWELTGFAIESYEDIYISRLAVLKTLDWDKMAVLLKIMADRDFDCNFWFTKQSMYELVKEVPMNSTLVHNSAYIKNAFEGKAIQGTSKYSKLSLNEFDNHIYALNYDTMYR